MIVVYECSRCGKVHRTSVPEGPPLEGMHHTTTCPGVLKAVAVLE